MCADENSVYGVLFHTCKLALQFTNQKMVCRGNAFLS